MYAYAILINASITHKRIYTENSLIMNYNDFFFVRDIRERQIDVVNRFFLILFTLSIKQFFKLNNHLYFIFFKSFCPLRKLRLKILKSFKNSTFLTVSTYCNGVFNHFFYQSNYRDAELQNQNNITLLRVLFPSIKTEWYTKGCA